ncbi:Lytic transglycosylase-like, catalytic domain protein [Candidatus Magnetobacterium bavaricum]|uniref:Lytic transglycosylase-like, catalytic domain protein n=1 Tax=Candidatus Magnetobacterium bavaricum TaxID=29290 RepID=A0A0F3GQG2_9BACT|nr:Lytic transglycosylase-like, catalytic domain protein [Candidatus Magnetobacterium bavaricum]
MIKNINDNRTDSVKDTRLGVAQSAEFSSGFKSILAGTLNEDGRLRPLEMSVVDSLRRILDIFLSHSNSGLFPSEETMFNGSSGVGSLFPVLPLPMYLPQMAQKRLATVPMKSNPAAVGVDTSNIKQASKASEQTAGVGSVKNEELKGINEQTATQRSDSLGIMENNNNNSADKKDEKASKSKSLDKYEELINESAQKYGVNPSLIKAVIIAESNGDPKAQSYAGARGLMQLMPSTAAGLGVKDSFDPKQNIMGGTRYLRQLLDRYNGDVRLTLAAYNWGMGNLERAPHKMPSETRNYITKVEGYYRNFVEDSAAPDMLMA